MPTTEKNLRVLIVDDDWDGADALSLVVEALGELKMTDRDGQNEHTHMVPAEAKILRNGKAASLGDLQKGDHFTVTTKTEDGKKTVTKIEAKSKIS